MDAKKVWLQLAVMQECAKRPFRKILHKAGNSVCFNENTGSHATLEIFEY